MSSRPPTRRTSTDADVAVVVPAGPDVIDVDGGVVSAGAVTVQPREAGDRSVFPARSVARTSNVCAPVPSAL